MTVYDPLMFVFSRHLSNAAKMRRLSDKFQNEITGFYQANYASFEGRNVNPSALIEREEKIEAFVIEVLSGP
jgi:hypothetical protein